MSPSYSRRHLPQPRQPQCEACGTEHQLTIHAITAIGAAGGDLVTVSYTCNDCDLFQEHTAYATDVAAALNQVRWMAQVVLFGDDYIHCGFPMEEAEFEVERPQVVLFGDDYIHCGFPMEEAEFEVERLCYRSSRSGSGLNAVSLPTRVLRCHCGFQLEVPE